MVNKAYDWNNISIHALREEGDQWKKDNLPTRQEFQSTPSARRATGDDYDVA